MSKFKVILLYIFWSLPMFTCKQFGFNNSYTCHCDFDSNCNQDAGQCYTNTCQRGWSGPSCQKQNVALGKNASQVSINMGRGAGLAADGDRDNSGPKCIDTGYNNNPSWSVDLQQTYPIKDINIVYQNNHLNTFYGFIINITEGNSVTRCYQHTGDGSSLSYDYNVTCNNNIDGQYVTIYIPRTGNQFLVLCEVEVYVCAVGTYGEDCNNFCYCLDNARCDYLLGTCPGKRCQAGWTGTNCNQECSPGSYGSNCLQPCSSNCLTSQNCNRVTGKCNGGCKRGYQGDTCTQECSPGSYGSNCLQPCSSNCLTSQNCNRVTGKCNGGCKRGYQGDTCTQDIDECAVGGSNNCNNNANCSNTLGSFTCTCRTGYNGDGVDCGKCSSGKYGQDCQSDCSLYCLDSQDCNHVNGNCNGGCKPGYQGNTCTQECSPDTYGLNCQQSCSVNCLNSQDCHHVNGKCNGGCTPGYQEDNCTQDCSQGYYGQDCKLPCENRHCNGSEECNHVTGRCIDGCDDGFAGDDCIKSKKFGFNKFYTCHCKDEGLCNNLNGRCPGDVCDSGWSGPSCQRQNVAFNKTSSQIHTINNGQASFAVDGNRDNVVNKGSISDTNPQKCTDTNNQNNPWWRVDLQQSYPIRDINIVYRQGHFYRFDGFRIDIETENGQNTNCYQHTGDTSSFNNYDVRCNNTINGRYVTITVPTTGNKKVYMVLCEVEVYVCSVGTYGVGCNTFCHCANNVRCDYLTGRCPSESCQAGWTGNDCNQVCNGSYGQDCSKDCDDRNCHGNQNCNHVTGICIDGCRPGYQSDDCTQQCQDKYGEKCGYDCKSRNCSGNQECHHVTGRCPEGCTAGYNKDDCTKECDNGYYGNNCSLACSQRFCSNDQASCNNVDGNCGGVCQTDYEGVDCKSLVKVNPDDGDIVIIASTVSVCVILIIIIVIVIIILRRRRLPQRKLTIKKNKNPNMAVVNPMVQTGNASIYENSAIIQRSLEAVDTEESGEIDNEEIELKDNVYYNLPNTESPPVTKSEFNYTELKDFIETTKAENGFGFLFESLTTEYSSPFDASQLNENKKKNRFKGYYPYDNTRVKLSIQDENPHTDFINANYLHGYNRPKAYIAAQGATDITTYDFIRMIWEQRCEKVVMVTREYEMAKMKCKRYWPETGTEMFGQFKLTLIQEQIRADFTIRVVSMQKDNSKHQFHQFHYTSWPDHGVPDVHDLLDFRFTVNKVKSKSTAPQIVHCSAGVGRTGTFIAIDICLKQWKATGQVEVMPCIKKMRDERKGMIQTDPQLKFVFEALLEGITRGDTILNKDIFEADYDKHGYDLKMGKMSSHEHFQLLKSIETDTANITKVYSEEKSLYSFPSYTNSKGYFFESLVGLDVDTMWKMIHDRQSTIAVFIRDNMKQTGLYPGSGSKEEYNDITVETISQENLSDKITRISVSVTQKELNTDLVVFILNIQKSQVKNFQYLSQHVLELLQHVSVDQRNDDSITIFSSNLQYVRVFCIMRNVLQRIMLDNEVEIVQNVRKMHQRIEKTIFTEEEFKVLFEVISEYIKSTGTYANM